MQVLQSAPARAQDRTLLDSARALQASGEHETAIVVLRRVLTGGDAGAGEARSLLAASAEALGQLEQARAHLRAALALSEDAWVEAHLAELSQRLAALAAESAPPTPLAPGEVPPAPPPGPIELPEGPGDTPPAQDDSPPPPPPPGETTTVPPPPPPTGWRQPVVRYDFIDSIAAEGDTPPAPTALPWRRRLRLQAFAGGGVTKLGTVGGAIDFGVSVHLGLVPMLSVHALAGASLQLTDERHEYSLEHDSGVDYSLAGRRQRNVYMVGGSLRLSLGRWPAFLGVGGTFNQEQAQYTDAWVEIRAPGSTLDARDRVDSIRRWVVHGQLLAELGLLLGSERTFELRGYARYRSGAVDAGVTLGVPIWVSR